MNIIPPTIQTTDYIRKFARVMPIAKFTTSRLWERARWTATTFRWHPTGEAPPVLGLVFENAEAGKELFQDLESAYNHVDRFEEMRISIIEDAAGSQPCGYSIHVCPDPDALAMHATGEDFVINPKLTACLGCWNRMYPAADSREMLPRFKDEFRRHGEFLLAPVTRREDGESYFDANLGFIKHAIEFRDISNISDNDIDAGALFMRRIMPARPT